MTVERLEILAADLYKEAEEATPIIGGADKMDWMARKLEEYIEQQGASLEELMRCENSEQVIDILEGQYDLWKDRDKDVETDNDQVTGIVDEEKAVKDAYVNPVADVLGVTDYDPVVLDENEIHQGESVEVKAFGKTENDTKAEDKIDENKGSSLLNKEQSKSLGETSSRTNELADTPETVAIPEDELLIVEETILIIEDEGIIPENVLKNETTDRPGCSERNS